MTFADETPERKGQIVGRIWSAIKADVRGLSDRAADELMEEWIEGLMLLTMDDIKRGVDACKARGFPAPVDEFVKLCSPPEQKQVSEIAKRELAKMRALLNEPADDGR